MIWKLIGIILIIVGVILFIRGISDAIKEVKGEKLWYKIVCFLLEGVSTGITLFGGIGYDLIPLSLLCMIAGVCLFLNIRL